MQYQGMTKLQLIEQLSKLQHYQNTFYQAPQSMLITDYYGRITEVNQMCSTLLGYPQQELASFHLIDLIDYEHIPVVMSLIDKIKKGGIHTERWQLRCKNKTVLTCEITGNKISPSLLQLLVRDITQSQLKEEKLRYISLHDPVTGIHNRTCFEQEMKRLNGKRHVPVSMIICDVDGLKLINDCMGHESGDSLLSTAAQIMKNVFRENDIVARIGGDEFAILLPYTSRLAVKKSCHRLQEAIEQYNKTNTGFPLSISIGSATSTGAAADMGEIFREADNNMYREKLRHSKNTRRKIIQSLLGTLHSLDSIEPNHINLVQNLVRSIAKRLSLPAHRIAALKRLVQFHNIGKVGISSRILHKKTPLTPPELMEIQRHSEIGYRIAQSIPDLIPIAEWILKHHEWWNGKGYPLGIQGEAIPLECRILAVAEAYETMTSICHGECMSHKDALEAIKQLAGIQFDPYIVKVFCENFSRRLRADSKLRTLR